MPVKEIGVGIDVARYRHVVQFLRPDRTRARKPLVVQESHEGYQRLRDAFQQLDQRFGHPLFRCVLDEANVYGRNLRCFLQSLPFRLVITTNNPLINRRYKQVFLLDHKNDAVDAQAAARFAVQEKPAPSPPVASWREALKLLVSHLESQTKQTTRLVNQLHRLLALAFPEFVAFFPYLKALTARALLRQFPSAQRLAAVSEDQLAAFQAKPGAKALGQKKAAALRLAAARSVGLIHDPSIEPLVRSLVEQLDHSLRTQAALQKAVTELYKAHRPNHLLSIPGSLGWGRSPRPCSPRPSATSSGSTRQRSSWATSASTQ